MRVARAAIAALWLSIVLSPAAAHHSTAEYNRSVLREIEGELTEVRWSNPHVMFKVRADNPGGQAEDWELTGLPIALLEGAGLAGNLFSVAIGQHVKAAGWASRTRASMLVNNLLLPSGDEALFYPQSTLRWSTQKAGGQWARESVSDAQRDLYRVWSVADLGAYIGMAQGISLNLTPAAQAKMANPPKLDVCRPQGMPGIMLNPLPMRFVDSGDHIDLQLASFGVLVESRWSRAPTGDVSLPISVTPPDAGLETLWRFAPRGWVGRTWTTTADRNRPTWRSSNGSRSVATAAASPIPKQSPTRFRSPDR